MGPLDWSWPEVVESSKSDVTLEDGASVGGLKWEEDPLWPWLSLCVGWRTDDPHVVQLIP